MKEILSDIVRQSTGLFTILKITGTEEHTRIGAVNDEKTLFMISQLREPVPEFAGEFGITNLGMLSRLLEHVPYRAEGSSFSVHRREMGGVEAADKLIFRDANKTDAKFHLMSIGAVPEQVELKGQITWDIVLTPDKSKLAEFTTLAGIFGEVDKTFAPKTEGDNLVFHVGVENSSMHNASMVFHNGVTGSLKGDLRYNTGHFLSVMKLAGQTPAEVSITSRGVMKITLTTPVGSYDYYLRSERG